MSRSEFQNAFMMLTFWTYLASFIITFMKIIVIISFARLLKITKGVMRAIF
ncbi:hypothetical protein D3C77_185450 [compost metagenome]